MVYYVLALALYADVSTPEVLRCVVEGARWLGEPSTTDLPTKSAISQARIRLGAAPLEALYRAVVTRIATEGTPGAWYRGWRVMSLDGTTLDVGDTAANAPAFGRPASARGVNATGAFPQLRLVGLLDNGTHAITGAQLGAYGTHERVLAVDVLAGLTGEMLCLADRGFLRFDLWRRATVTGAALVRRAPAVRVVEYTVAGGPTPATVYRLVTSILEPARAPAADLAALYHERWEMKTAFDELRTPLRGAQRVLRSKTPDLVHQELWGFLLPHFALRALMHEAALGALPRARDPDTVSCTHTLCVTRRTRSPVAALPPQDLPRRTHARQHVLAEIRSEVVSSSRGRVVPRGVKRRMSNYSLRPRRRHPTTRGRSTIDVIVRHRPASGWSRRPPF